MTARKLTMAAALAASALTGLPSATLAEGHGHAYGHYKHHHRHYDGYREGYYDDRPRYYRERYDEPPRYYGSRRDCRTSGTTGLIIGGAAGALLGREIDGGRDRTTGTILGAGTGALLGREISRKSRC
ncbi:glycine zipper 2TM domain-containing protein [Phenylobacterium sp.]|jgi:hypothetical protein|uniref:glycine zipper 2TM domain-containing protein n=1 Tax=Phenylobacterium sp. TaxID=1871053 RepID=UPI002F414B36